jgi:hypothetical protein
LAQSNSSSKSGGEGGGGGGDDEQAIMIVVAAAAVVMGGGGFLADRLGVFTSVTQMLWWATPLVSAGVFAIVGLWRFRIHMRRRKMSRGARLVQIGVPPMGRGGARPSGDEGALFWSTLHTVLAQSTTGLPRLWGPPHVSWEFLARHGETIMRMWVPEEIPVAVIERTVGAAWQGADVSSMEVSGVDDRLFGEDQKLAMRELWYEGDPVRGGAGMRSGGDTLRTLTGQFAKLTGTDAMLVQIMTRPASFSERMKDKFKKLREKEGASKSREETQPATYRIMMRVAAMGDDKRLCRERASGLAGAFAAIAPGQRRMKQDRILSARAPRRITGRMMRNRGSLLTSQDIAQMAHLPASDTPGVERAGARLHAPPPRLPTYGKPIGRCIDGQVAFLTPEDSRYHTHIMGPTGVGKSTLITAMVIADIREGRGGVVLDPKGDLVDDILRRCPPEAMDKIDVLDPRDHVTPSINLLDGDDPHQMADGITAVFARTFSDAWGPRMSEIFEAALVTLGKVLPDATLADLPRLLDDDDWRAGVTAKLDDPIGLESFWDDYDKMSGSARNQAIGPVLSRLRNFIMRPNVRYLVSQPNTTISIADAFDNGRMVLVSVPKGSLGEQTSKLLGSLVVSRAWTAAMERVNVPEKDRPDCSLYIDEVHNYLSIPTSLEQMLAEARAFHMAMCMAHQSLSQLPQDMREGLGANARNKIYFRLEAGDSRQVERDVEPVVNSNDLNSLDAYMTISRLVHKGQVMAPFTVYTEPLPGADDELMEEIKRRSRERCGRPREDIEAELRARRHELDQDLGVQSDPTKAIEADPRATGDEAPPADDQVGAHSGDPEERDLTAQQDEKRIKQERPQKKDRLAGLPPEERAKREAQAERDRERARQAKENKEAKEQEKDKVA